MEVEIKTASNCYPGRLVIRDTSDGNVQVAGNGATDVLGVLDVEPAELRSTIYGVGDQARVLHGDCVVLVEAISGAVITAGLTLLAATGGTVIQGTTAGAVIGVAQTSASPTSTGTFVQVHMTR
jgi:hypothetical protein